MNNKRIKLVLAALLTCMLLMQFTGCYRMREREYYSDENNFITITAELSHCAWDAEQKMVCLAFCDLPDFFSDVNFIVSDDNWEILVLKGGANCFELGKKYTFVTAPRYFGDGYAMPIVAISIDGNILLDYETGYQNFMKKYTK